MRKPSCSSRTSRSISLTEWGVSPAMLDQHIFIDRIHVHSTPRGFTTFSVVLQRRRDMGYRPDTKSIAQCSAVAPRIGPSLQKALFPIDADGVCVAHVVVPICDHLYRLPAPFQLTHDLIGDAPFERQVAEGVPQVRPISQRGASIACCTS